MPRLTAAEQVEFTALLALFAGLGFPLEHFPSRGELVECWQYDGGYDGVVVWLKLGTNGLGRTGVFGDITFPDGSATDITATLDGWVADMRGWVTTCLKGG